MNCAWIDRKIARFFEPPLAWPLRYAWQNTRRIDDEHLYISFESPDGPAKIHKDNGTWRYCMGFTLGDAERGRSRGLFVRV